jgi:hypothetical protein
MQSPTGCTKQLISVAWMSVPAALMMRPGADGAGMQVVQEQASYFSPDRLRLDRGQRAGHAPVNVLGRFRRL